MCYKKVGQMMNSIKERNNSTFSVFERASYKKSPEWRFKAEASKHSVFERSVYSRTEDDRNIWAIIKRKIREKRRED